MDNDDRHSKIATAFAAAALSSRGYTMFHVDGDTWDVERPDGGWLAANGWRELCRIEHSSRDGIVREANQ